MTGPTLATRIDEAWTGLTPHEQRVAGFLRSRPEESALYNSSELARLTGVSKATVSRLFRRLGFTGSQEVRDLLRAQRTAGVPVVVDALADAAAVSLARDVGNLQRFAAALDTEALGAAAAAIAAAPRVVVTGFRSGFPIAALLRQALAQARADVRLVPEAAQTIAEELVGLGPEDAVVIVGLRRRPSGFGEMAAAARAITPNLVLIADPTLRPTAARWRFDVPIESASPFDSYAAAASLVSVLAGEVLARCGAEGAERVRSIDRAYAALGELEPS